MATNESMHANKRRVCMYDLCEFVEHSIDGAPWFRTYIPTYIDLTTHSATKLLT